MSEAALKPRGSEAALKPRGSEAALKPRGSERPWPPPDAGPSEALQGIPIRDSSFAPNGSCPGGVERAGRSRFPVPKEDKLTSESVRTFAGCVACGSLSARSSPGLPQPEKNASDICSRSRR